MRTSRPFRFKRFTVAQEHAAMKVGTDGVLLGAWCKVDECTARVLDIGTGTGLISLMLAQRGEAWDIKVDAIEPETGALSDAETNIAGSPWAGKVNLSADKLQDYGPSDKYDLIVCNPPYFTSSLLSPSGERTKARHDVSLSRGELVSKAGQLCRSGGRFAIIIPTEQAGDYITECDFKGFAPSRRTDVRTTPSAAPKRTLLEFVFRPAVHSPCVRDELVIETAPLSYTPEYIELTREFYIKFP